MDFNKLRDTLYAFLILGAINSNKKLILHKLIYEFSRIPIKITVVLKNNLNK